jgi:hypothetical protein
MTCPTCNGEGFVITFRRFAGEYQAGEPVEVPCPEGCDPDDGPEADDDTGITLAELRAMYGDPLSDEGLTEVHSDPFLNDRRAA